MPEKVDQLKNINNDIRNGFSLNNDVKALPPHPLPHFHRTESRGFAP